MMLVLMRQIQKDSLYKLSLLFHIGTAGQFLIIALSVLESCKNCWMGFTKILSETLGIL